MGLDSGRGLNFVLVMFSPASALGPVLHVPKTMLRAGTVHECRAPEATAGHMAVVTVLLAQLPGSVPILWVSRTADAYPPGLAWLGLDPARCLFAEAKDDPQILSMLETGLRGGMAGVAECCALPRLAARRLALAAKTGGGIGFLLRHAAAFTPADSSAFATRWLISPAPGGLLLARLLYAKSGRTGKFLYEISEEKKHGTAPYTLTLVEPGIAAGGQRRTG